MARRLLGVALSVIGLAGTAAAQNPYLPNQGRSMVMADPVPVAPAIAPMNPGMGMGGQGMPMGGAGMAMGGPMESEAPNSLPGHLPNAWTENDVIDQAHLYTSLAYIGLNREKLGHGPVGVLSSDGTIFGDYRDLNPRMNNGLKVMAGLHYGDRAIEFSGFYTGESNSSKSYASSQNLNTGFFNQSPEFASLSANADFVQTRLQTWLYGGEVNYRYWPGKESEISLLIGCRYLDIKERFGIYTGENDGSAPDPTTQALYETTVHNRIVAPQLGLEWNKTINSWLAVTWNVKGAWGVNFVDVDSSLKRGDGLIGAVTHRSATNFSHVYETGLFADISVMENIRIRAGYNLIWAADVTDASSQVDLNILSPTLNARDGSSIFYHGPVVEVHVLF